MIDQEKIHNQCFSQDPKERIKGLEQLEDNFSTLSNKQQAWNDLHNLTNDKDNYVKYTTALVLLNKFYQLPDKQQAWNDLLRLMNDLTRLNNDISSSGGLTIAQCLSMVVSNVPDVQQAWNDLIRMTKDEYSSVRHGAASALRIVCYKVPDKQQIWNDLHKLICDEDHYVRYGAAEALGSVFSKLPDKQQAWNDLHKLVCDIDWFVRSGAVKVLGSAFSQVPNEYKQQAWNDLHKLICDEDHYVRYWAAGTLGSAFSYVPDEYKQQAWDDLHRLTIDEDSDVRSNAKHALGRVYIFKSSQAATDEDYKTELENAIKFFEQSSKESVNRYDNPAQFCLPFYRSFHSILFKKQEAKDEINKYLEEAKAAAEGSKSKELLFEAVENLAEALKEVQNMGNLDLSEMKDELSFYRRYCDHAAELMKYTDEKSPFATEVLRKGLPILDRNLKELLEEIQEKAKTVCQVPQGTATKEIACAVSEEVHKWEIGSQEEMSRYVPNIVLLLKSKIPHTLENEEILGMIESMKYEKDLTKQYRTLSSVIGLIPTVNVVPIEPVIEKIESSQREILEEIRKNGEKLDDVIISLKPGLREELILHIGAISSVGGGVEYTLTVPLHGLSYPEIKEDLREIFGKRISQLSMLPKKIAKIVKEYLIENQMEDLLSKLC